MRSRPSSDSVPHPYQSSCPPRETQGPSTGCFCYCFYPNNSHILQSSPSLPTELYSPVVPLSRHMNFPAAPQVQLFQKQSYCLSLLSRSPPSTGKHLLPCSSEPWWRAGWLFLNIQRTFLTLTPTFTQWPSSLELSPDLPLTVLVLSHITLSFSPIGVPLNLAFYLASLSWNPFHLPFHHAQKQILKFVLRI